MFSFELREHEGVDRRSNPLAVAHRGRIDRFDFLQRPVLMLLRGERIVALRGARERRRDD